MAETTNTTTTAKPVANLAQARKEQAAARNAEAASKAAHPAGSKRPAAKAAPAKSARAKSASKKAAKPEGEKLTYSATARCGKVNSRTSAAPLLAALDVRISQPARKGEHWQRGVIVAMYSSVEAAGKVAAEINSGSGADGWSDAIVVPVTVASAKAVS
jgi:hypothetical protein